MFYNALLSAKTTAWIIDIVAVLFIFIMVSACARKGFIDCFFGTITTLLALVVAFSFTKIFVEMSGGLFGVEELLQGKFESVFAKINGFNADVSESGVEAAIKEQNVSAIMARLVMKTVGNQENIPAGTTLAMLLSEATSGLAVTLIAGLALFIVTKICVRMLRNILKVIADHIKLLHGVNILLGATVGLLEALLILCAALAVLTLFPNETITAYLSETLFIGELYVNNPLVSILGTMI